MDYSTLTVPQIVTMWAAFDALRRSLKDGLGKDQHGRFMTDSYNANLDGMIAELRPHMEAVGRGLTKEKRQADIERAKATANDRIRFDMILDLLGLSQEEVDAKLVAFDMAVAEHPTGALVLTHGPFDDAVSDVTTTFENLVALTWQDDDDGSDFTILLWERE